MAQQRRRITELDKDRARRKAQLAVRQGRIDRKPCEWQDETGTVCGVEPTDGHHDDYDEPLRVLWLCRTHHARLHADVKPVALARPGDTVSLRRFRNDTQVLTEPVRVIRAHRDGSREFVGIWYPAWMVEEH